jgi:long-chain fatty acid transport protein
MRIFKLTLMTAILLSFCIGSLFAGGFALSGIGSKAISLGGAFRGMADDPTAMYWNPAGLGFMTNSKLAIAGAGIMPTVEFQNNQALPGFTADNIKCDPKLWMFPNIYMVKASESKFKWGLGVYVPYGLGATYDLFDLPATMPVAGVGNVPLTWTAGFPEKETKSSIGIVDAHPTVAYQLSDNVSLGAGLSVYYGMISISKVKPHALLSYYLPTTMKLEGTGMGYGANLGMLWKVSDSAQIGLSGKIPATVKLKGDADIITWISDVVNTGNPLIPGTSALALGFNPDITADLNLPGDIGWGFSLKATPKWTLNADFSYTFWSNLDKITIEMDSINILGTPMTESELSTKWNDTFRVCLGTQYQMEKIALRGGFFFDQSPAPDETLTPTLPDTADKYSGNFGLGWQLGKFLLDLNYEHVFFAQREIKTQTLDNMAGTYKNGVNAFNMGLTYNF